MTTQIIKAETTDEGGYRLVDADGNYPQEGKVHSSRQSAYRDASFLWPHNSTWEGRKIHCGYLIVVD